MKQVIYNIAHGCYDLDLATTTAALKQVITAIINDEYKPDADDKITLGRITAAIALCDYLAEQYGVYCDAKGNFFYVFETSGARSAISQAAMRGILAATFESDIKGPEDLGKVMYLYAAMLEDADNGKPTANIKARQWLEIMLGVMTAATVEDEAVPDGATVH
ncbi:hypothetical protein NMJ21_000279 [Escherichia coli]|nr:hypothetical protein [Escherichia coli]EFH9059811.1 hypothetical protein [Escherichia coli]EFK5491822.1 hypothetical protein [Escherichia coli]EGJ3266850.1 hypothetical protein [Escherichia coli]EHV9324243.1 hypothetical protein [Escherichia coli]